MGQTHSEYLVLLVLDSIMVCMYFTVSFLGESEDRYEHPVLEDHRHPGGREDGQTCVAQEHPNRG